MRIRLKEKKIKGMGKHPCLILPNAKNGLFVRRPCILAHLIVSCFVEPVQCTERYDLEHEVTAPITRQPTKGKLQGRSKYNQNLVSNQLMRFKLPP